MQPDTDLLTGADLRALLDCVFLLIKRDAVAAFEHCQRAQRVEHTRGAGQRFVARANARFDAASQPVLVLIQLPPILLNQTAKVILA